MPEARKKVFDVAKPGSTDPDIGSKPMAAGHTYMQSDPTLTSSTNAVLGPPSVSDAQSTQPLATSSPQQQSVDVTMQPVAKKKVITPMETATVEIAAEPATAQETVENNEVGTAANTENVQKGANEAEAPSSASSNTVTTSDDGDVDEVLSDDEKALALDEIIKSKQYYVPIKESSGKNQRSAALVIVAVIGVLVALYLLVDAAILDIGIEVPFTIIGK